MHSAHTPQAPVLIEAMSYRSGHHSTSDDSSRWVGREGQLNAAVVASNGKQRQAQAWTLLGTKLYLSGAQKGRDPECLAPLALPADTGLLRR